MKRSLETLLGFILGVVLTVVICSMAHADPIAAPKAVANFCKRVPSVCFEAKPASATQDQIATIIEVNGLVNGRVPPLADSLNPTSSDDRWDIVMPGAPGDCEDYAVTKAALLEWRGIPRGAMHFAIVSFVDFTGATVNHVVLVVRIRGAEFVLDSLDPNVQPVEHPPYRWLMISREGSLWSWSTLDGAPQ